jgi:hypothetical protein
VLVMEILNSQHLSRRMKENSWMLQVTNEKVNRQ